MLLDGKQCLFVVVIYLFFIYFSSPACLLSINWPRLQTHMRFSFRFSGEYEGYISCDRKYMVNFWNNSQMQDSRVHFLFLHFIHILLCHNKINTLSSSTLNSPRMSKWSCFSFLNACQCNLHELRSNNMPPERRTRTVLRHWSGEGYRSVCFTLVPTVASIILEWKKHGQTRSLSRARQKMSNHSDRAPESRCADGRTFQMVTHHCRPPWSG